jgi:uncharacterized membrane protein YccC
VWQVEKIRRWLRLHLRGRRVQIGQALRVTIAALVALLISQYLALPLPLWAVLTAVIVTQLSIGRSLKVTIDYLVGTLGGAVYGGVIAVFLPHMTEAALLAVLALAIAPLALLAAISPRYNVAPITAIIVLLVPAMTHATPFDSAVNRVLEVVIGGFIGLIVSFVVLPSSAHQQTRVAAARALDMMAHALAELLGGLTGGLDVESQHRIQDGIGEALVRLSTVATEAEHERSARLSGGADTGPLMRTLVRLRHDLVMIGRAAVMPLPEAFRERLGPTLAQIGAASTEYLRSSGAALIARGPPPPSDPLDLALESYGREIAALRQEGLTRSLPGDVAERFFAIGFSLEQLHQNFRDLARCVSESAQPA